jgi:translocation and assembly module TamB
MDPTGRVSHSDKPKPKKRLPRSLRKILKALLWGAALGSALLLLGVGVLHIDAVQQRLKAFAVSTVEAQTGLELELGAVSGNLVRHLSFESVQLSADGQPVIRAERMTIRYALCALLRRVVHIRQLQIENPHVRLTRDSAGKLAFPRLRPSSPTHSAPDSKPRLRVRLDRLSLLKGSVSVPDSAPRRPERIVLDDITVDAGLKLGPALEARIRKAALTLPSRQLVLNALSGAVRLDPQSEQLTIQSLNVRTAASELSIDGRIRRLHTNPDVFLTADIRTLAVKELGQALSIPALDGGNVSGRIELRGNSDRLVHRVSLALAQQTAEMSGVVSGIRSGTLSRETTGRLQKLNPQNWPGTRARLPHGDIRIDFTLSGHHLLQSERRIGLQLTLGSGELAGYRLNGGSIDLRLRDGDLVLKDARLESPGLNVRLLGRLEGIGTGPIPASFQIEASARDFDMRVLGAPSVLDGRVTADLTFEAAGDLSAETAPDWGAWRAEADLRMDRSRLFGADIRRAEVTASWNGRFIDVQSLQLDSDLLQAALQGRFSGTGEDFGFTGRAVVEDLARFYTELRARGLPLPAEPVPTGKLRMTGALQSAGGKSDLSAAVQASGLQVAQSRIERAALNLRLHLETDEKRIQIDTLRLIDIGNSFTRPIPEVVSTAPIHIEVHRDRIDILSLQLAAGEARLTAEGRMVREGPQDLTLELTGLAVNRLAFLRYTEDLSGQLSLQAHVEGSPAAPQITFLARVRKFGRGADAAFSQIDAQLNYRGKKASWTVAGRRGQRRIFDLTGSTGLALTLQPLEFRLTPDSLDARLEAERVDLAEWPLPDLLGFQLQGLLRIDARAGGDIRRPQVEGRLVLQNGSLTSMRYGLSYESVAAELVFTPQKLTIQNLEIAGDREGVLRGSGVLVLDGLQPSAVKVQVVARQLAVDWDRTVWVTFDSKLSLAGRMSAPILTGEISVSESRINLDRLAEGGPADIVVLGDPSIGDRQVIVVEEIAERKNFFSALKVDIRVEVPGNSWLRGQGLRAEVAGTVDLKKERAGSWRMFGDLNAVRGNYEFQSRRFRITRGTIEFIGLEEPDPILDIRAATRIRDVSIFVHLAGSARRIELSLDSDPPMEQSDIVAYLVFGQPTGNLRWQQSTRAEIAALNLTGKIAAAELQDILADVLGLDMVTFDFGGDDLRTGSLAIGKYVTRNIFVTYRHGLATTDLGEIEVDYQINKNFSVQTQFGDELSTGIDLIWQHDF